MRKKGLRTAKIALIVCIVAQLVAMVALLGLLSGCEEQQAKNPEVRPMRANLLPTHAEWVKAYGDDDESNLHSNIWQIEQWGKVLSERFIKIEQELYGDDPNAYRQVVNRQGAALLELIEKQKALEEQLKDIEDRLKEKADKPDDGWTLPIGIYETE